MCDRRSLYRGRWVGVALWSMLAAFGSSGPARAEEEPPATSCTVCHADPDLFEDDALRAIPEQWAEGIHAAVGISCNDCHGGNPDLRVADDMDLAMDPDFSDQPFVGSPDFKEIPDFCGHCHSDADFMKRYAPAIRVDQEQEYWTSRHGQLLRKDDAAVANCTSCHGVHGILKPTDPRAPVYPTHVAETCGKCHADPRHMDGRTLPDGSPLPVDQLNRWRRSVHGKALMETGDLFAPTCNDCHGNHGAIPPGLNSIAFVCGQCHAREAELFRASPKHDGFAQHEVFLESAGEDACADCHEEQPQASQKSVRDFGECTVCHSNHSIVRPTVSMLSPLPEVPCSICHGDLDPSEQPVPEPALKLERFQTQKARLLEEAKALGLEGEARFDWLVDRLQELPFHTETVRDIDGVETTQLRPEFGRLFHKFRVAKTHFTFVDPATGSEGSGRVRRCSDCHSSSPELADEPVGLTTSTEMLEGMRELETLTARAERILLEAKRGGVEVGKAEEELDQAVSASISLQVLLHTFDSSPEGPFMKAHQAGVAHAQEALLIGKASLSELTVRRNGLKVSLALIALVLIGLAVLIRRIWIHAN